MVTLTDGWEVTPTAPGRYEHPSGLDGVSWVPAAVPGTAAAAVGVGDGRDFDAEDWWFRCRFSLDDPAAQPEHELALGGIATVAEVYLNGQLLLQSDSMWAAHRVDVRDLLRTENELVIACRALTPLLARRRRPSPRWRTRVVNSGNLRWYRTMMFGRSPGFAPGPAPVGPWRPVALTRPPVLRGLSIRTHVDGRDGIVEVRGQASHGTAELEASLAGERVAFAIAPDGTASATLRVPEVALWWPHTHGDPTLYDFSIEHHGDLREIRRVGFRRLRWGTKPIDSGLALWVNDVPIFIRGAVWTPPDLVTMAPAPESLRALLSSVRDAGMNMLRVVGTGAYESSTFHDLCDELGILVWQDLMFANLDYPIDDVAFRKTVLDEAEQVLQSLSAHPSLTVVCGNSEVGQQPAMMGLDPALGRSELWEDLLAAVAARLTPDCAYLPTTPCGGDLPFHSDRGVSHYFGVSGYFRPPEDARRADVRFAAESLAFANVPDDVSVPAHHPDWKRGVQRDAGTGWDLGAGWDFDDVRDFYLQLLYEVDPVQLRRSDHARYLELSRATTGEVMAEVMGEWRRDGSPCRGALVLWLKDMLPGAGLGVIDHAGLPKVAYHYLRRALSPTAVWMTDEGVNGVAVHVANDGPVPLRAELRVALYRDHEVRVDETSEPLALEPHTQRRLSVEGMLGRYVDAAWAYRFGPPGQDVIVATLQPRDGAEPLAQAFHFPAGRPAERLSAADLGLQAHWRDDEDQTRSIVLTTRRLAYAVRVKVAGLEPEDDAFSIEPGGQRTLRLRATDPAPKYGGGHVTALNAVAPITIQEAP